MSATKEKKFELYLKEKNLAHNTIVSYLSSLKQYNERYSTLTKQHLCEYKMFLIENYKPQTVNLRIRAINCYLECIERDNLKITTIKVQQKPFLEYVISEADYMYFKQKLKDNDEIFWYFVVRFLATTGARVSELVQIKYEHVRIGYLDLYSKGGKLRRIYIPQTLQAEALYWMESEQKLSGFIFVNRSGDQMTPRGIAGQLKHFAILYGLDPVVIYPHSFRHLFAKNFLARYNDIAMLADLMGHESIETTRIYLRKTNTEQQNIINQVIDW